MKVTRLIALMLAMLTAATLFACDSSDDKDDDASAQTTTELNGDLDGDGEVDFQEPITDYGDLNELYDIGYDLMENVTDISTVGITLWDDGAAEHFFDGDDMTSKLGGKELVFPVDIIWNTDVATTLKAYILYTGNDSSEFTGRSPISWVLYGSNDGENWTEIDAVDESGMGNEDAVPYGFLVDSPAPYTSYKLSVTSTNGPVEDGGMELQLNEMVLIGDVND